ncbi:MAG: adenylate/guanylate cyclase domain-containing protein, partial [Ferruginibacter sp.]
MTSLTSSYSIFSGLGKYRIRTIFIIAIFWTVIDIIAVQLFKDTDVKSPFKSGLLRELAVFIMSCVMGYLFVFTLKNVFRRQSPFTNFIFKSIILLIAAFTINFIVHFVDSIFIMGKGSHEALKLSLNEIVHIKLLLQRIIYWMILFVVTQLYIEINEKYSPGVFVDIITGKYMQPKIENRIIMFMDLKDSTPIAEKLGHVENFKFIRDFIFHVSMAMIEHDGRIYQYVGDEVVVSWLYNKSNTKKCMASIIEARKNLQKYSDEFRRRYDIAPEFRVGVHMGEVTVGEIGVIKKDLAMSGDTMNTTARIRSACTELNQKF